MLNEYFKTTKTQILREQKTILKVMHLNINGIIAKKYKLIKMLQELDPAVIGITETHLKNDMEIHIAGYEWVGENN